MGMDPLTLGLVISSIGSSVIGGLTSGGSSTQERESFSGTAIDPTQYGASAKQMMEALFGSAGDYARSPIDLSGAAVQPLGTWAQDPAASSPQRLVAQGFGPDLSPGTFTTPQRTAVPRSGESYAQTRRAYTDAQKAAAQRTGGRAGVFTAAPRPPQAPSAPASSDPMAAAQLLLHATTGRAV